MANLPIVADFVEPGTPTTDDQRPEFQHMIARIATISPFTDKALLESLSVRVWLTLSATLTRQSGSNQVSGRSLPKTGISPEPGRDFRRFGRPEALSGKMETGIRCVKARQRRAFLELDEVSSRKPDWLAGDAVLIAPVSRANSLLTGNFTGKIAILGVLRRDSHGKKPLSCSDFSHNSLCKLTGKIF
jgi:hypothetical protein